ncbi:MAG: peptidylprolyl isomerase [Bacteroidetes bacterium]|nr:peptidylprolyl isomerase [Bacteroidota bacterium]
MYKLVLSCLCAGLATTSLQAQTLFTYGGKPVSKQEFLKVYEKNNVKHHADMSEAALRQYLDLYSLFKMKVAEADQMHLDTAVGISAELDNYRRQLSRNYLTDKEVTNKLIQEAYNRMKEEVHVAHILISVSPAALPADTAKAYAKIDSLYNALIKGKTDFATLASRFSDDKGSKENGGDIGFMTALQTIYPFENAAYNTPVGKVSKPFRTQFGYHIVKVLGKRPARGEVQVAQILLTTPKSKGAEGIAFARRQADTVEHLLHQGVSFDSLVSRYSEDRLSAGEHGVLQPFGPGRMVPAFENAAFALKNPGDISEPIQTEYGFHIIRLIRKMPLKPFDSLRESIARSVENDSRAEIARTQFLEKIKREHGFKDFPEAYTAIIRRMKSFPDTGTRAHAFLADDYKDMHQPVFELAGQKYLQSDFMRYAQNVTGLRLNGPKEAILKDVYKMYVSRTVNDYEEHYLAETNPDFRSLMEEYRDGIMLFDLMDRNVWTKASHDTVGLKKYYEAHKGKWQWEPGFKGAVYHFKDDASLQKGMEILRKYPEIKDEIVYRNLNTESQADAVNIQHGRYEFAHFNDVPRAYIIQGKASKAAPDGKGGFNVVVAEKLYPQSEPKTLDEARGYVVAEYQDALEKSWNTQLRAKYPLKVDETVFRSMIQKN